MENMQISKENDNTLANKKQNTEIYDANGNVITVDNIKNILEKDLIQRAINGEKNAFNELYTKSYRYVLFVTKQYISNDETAYDAIQETFIKVYKGIKKLRSPDAFYGWISTIAKNTAIDIMRAAHYEVNISYEENDETIANKERNYDISLDVQSVLKKLSADDTKILSLVYYDGLRVSQIAKMQGVPATTVYSRLNKAKKNLSHYLPLNILHNQQYIGISQHHHSKELQKAQYLHKIHVHTYLF